MGQEFLLAVDWTAPWLAPYRALGQQVCAAPDWRAELNRKARAGRLANFQGFPLRFIPQEDLPEGTPYEAHIGATGSVPTRDNLHDFFNALVWLTFPATKARLNELQFKQLQRAALPGASGAYKIGERRGALRDAATIFDENAAVLVTKDPRIVESISRHRWDEAFLERRDAFGREYTVILFGHALMEKLVRPYKAITAHCFHVACEVSPASVPLDALDSEVSRCLSGETSTAVFFPMPVLGLPGWWPEQDANFYADSSVFRPPKASALPKPQS